MAGGPLFLVVMLACAGCQTFSLSQEDFHRQQEGGTVDRETGQVVGVVGTAGYYGAILGEVVASALRK